MTALLSVLDSTRVLTWLLLGMVALVGFTFWRFHQMRQELAEAKRPTPVPPPLEEQLDAQVRAGIALRETAKRATPDKAQGVLTRAKQWSMRAGGVLVEASPAHIDDFIAAGPSSQADEPMTAVVDVINSKLAVLKAIRRGDPLPAKQVEEVAPPQDQVTTFARRFAGWVKSQELEAPPDLSDALDDDYQREQAEKVADGHLSAEDYDRLMRPLTKRREWERQMRASYQRDWRADVGDWFDWAKGENKLAKDEMLASLHADNPQNLDELNELVESLERLAGLRQGVPLAEKIEALISEGMKIVDAIAEPAPEAPPGKLEPNRKALEIADDFFERARQLVIDNHRPSLIPVLEDAVNEHRRRALADWERENVALHERASKRKGLNAAKMRHWIARDHMLAVGTVQGTLYGLSAVARREAGNQ